MLPSANRMRRAADFSTVVRAGQRARRGSLVVMHRAELHPGEPATVGLIVASAVGGSVVRHAVSRRLRAQLAPQLPSLPPGSGTVVRALPPAAAATSRQLGADLESALRRLTRRVVG